MHTAKNQEWETQSSYEFSGEFWGEIARMHTHAQIHTRYVCITHWHSCTRNEEKSRIQKEKHTSGMLREAGMLSYRLMLS